MTMPPRLSTWSRSLALALALTAPTALALLILSVAGKVAPDAALWAIAAVLAVLLVAAWRHLSYLLDLAKRLTGSHPPPEAAQRIAPALAMAPELDRAVTEATLSWQARLRQLEGTVAGDAAVFASLPDPLIMVDADQVVVRTNPAARTLFGEGVEGRPLAEVLRNPVVLEAIQAVAPGHPGRTVEFTMPVPVERSFSARIEPLPEPAADGTVAILALHDLSALKRADQMRVDFVANASHELRTPLSTLIGFIETLGGPARNDPEARDRFLTIMLEQAQRMARLVADLLSLSRIELNEHTQPTGRVDLGHLLRGVADALEMKAGERGMRILVETAGDLPKVVGDPDELAQVFQNLIDNAIKYSRANTVVHVAARAVDPSMIRAPRRLSRDAIAVTVADEGEGIAREHLPRLTERFYRVDSARSRLLGGTGLGLAIVKHIVNRHRGHLDIESTVGQGSTFTVYLRAAAHS